MPCSRHNSATGIPPSACRRIATICASVYLIVLIISACLHSESPHTSCRENSTYADPCLRGGLPSDGRGKGKIREEVTVRKTEPRRTVLHGQARHFPLSLHAHRGRPFGREVEQARPDCRRHCQSGRSCVRSGKTAARAGASGMKTAAERRSLQGKCKARRDPRPAYAPTPDPQPQGRRPRSVPFHR